MPTVPLLAGEAGRCSHGTTYWTEKSQAVPPKGDAVPVEVSSAAYNVLFG